MDDPFKHDHFLKTMNFNKLIKRCNQSSSIISLALAMRLTTSLTSTQCFLLWQIFAPCRPKINKLLVLEYVIAYGWFFNTHKTHKRKKKKKKRNFGFEDMSPPLDGPSPPKVWHHFVIL